MPADQRSLEDRLSRHPELHQKIEQLVQLVESGDDNLARADEAERQVIETLRAMGHDALLAWANGRIEQTSRQSSKDPGLRPQGQKNSTGVVPTE